MTYWLTGLWFEMCNEGVCVSLNFRLTEERFNRIRPLLPNSGAPR